LQGTWVAVRPPAKTISIRILSPQPGGPTHAGAILQQIPNVRPTPTVPLPPGSRPIIVVACLPAYQSSKLVYGGPKKVALLDPNPPFGGALSQSKHEQEAEEPCCQSPIFRLNRINELCFV